MRSDGSAGQDPNARHDAAVRRRRAAARGGASACKDQYTQGHVVEGVIGSSDVWNSELDRIQHFHDSSARRVEEMEAASAAQIAGLFQIPFLGIRVLSNNITNGDAYDGATAESCQRFVIQVIGSYAAQHRSR